MKPVLFLSFLILASSFAYSQDVSNQMTDDFKDISKYGSRGSGFESFQTYHSGNVEGSQFFSPSWTTGTVTMINNQQFASRYLFLFDKVRQELFVKIKDSPIVIQADKDQIGSFTLLTDRVHSFVAAATLDPSNKGNFFEVLVKDNKGYSLFKLVKTKFIRADQHRDIETQAMGEVTDSFQDQVSYYIIRNGVVQTVALRKNNISKALSNEKDKVSAYFDKRSDSPIDESFLIGLIEYINAPI
jgi:hypothetical protein